MNNYDIIQASIKYDAASNERCFIVDLDPSDLAMNSRAPKQQSNLGVDILKLIPPWV
jgi:hypothetical protein